LRKKIFSLLFPFFASILSGVLLVLAFPMYDLWWTAWIGLVPLFIAISGRRPKQGFFLSIVCSFVFFPGVFDWILMVPGYKIHHHFLLGIYLGLYLGFFGLIFSYISRRLSITAALWSAPFIWVSLEYIRSNFFFLALPWALLGHSQYKNLSIIQIASLTGAYGISFLVVLANSAITAVILMLTCRSERCKASILNPPSIKGAISMGVVVAVLTGSALLYGKMTLNKPASEERIKVSVLQGNIEADKKWDPKYANAIMQTYIDLSNKASEDKPALIIWPEAATPGFVLKRIDLLSQTMSLIRQTKTYYLIGSAEYSKFTKTPKNLKKSGNTALFFSPTAKVLGQYLKIRLVPFREHIPYREIIPWPSFIIPKDKKTFENPGKEYTIFELDGIKFGVSICWESLFPELSREFVKKDAAFIINITSETSFGETAFPYQFLVTNLFRAVENRRAIARAANTGISCFIDPYGRVTGKVLDNNKDIFVKGYLTQEIPLSHKKTFYTLYGDILAYISLIVTVFMIVLSFIYGKKYKEKRHNHANTKP
jgi:apolipoprotein N-acyltransferase